MTTAIKVSEGLAQVQTQGWPDPHQTDEGRLELLLILLRLRDKSCLLGATFSMHPQLLGLGGERENILQCF